METKPCPMSPLGNRISFVFTLREKRRHCRPLGRGPMRSNLCFYRITPAARGTGSSRKITSEAIAKVPERDGSPLNQVSGNEGNNGKLSKCRLILQVEIRGLVEGHTQSMKEQEDQGWWPWLLTWWTRGMDLSLEMRKAAGAFCGNSTSSVWSC